MRSGCILDGYDAMMLIERARENGWSIVRLLYELAAETGQVLHGDVRALAVELVDRASQRQHQVLVELAKIRDPRAQEICEAVRSWLLDHIDTPFKTTRKGKDAN